MSTNTLTINDVKIRYRDSGGDGPVLFMSSGVGQSLEFWDRQFDALKDRYRLIAWDYPCHGMSSMDPDGFSIGGLTSYAIKLLDALNVEHATLVGNSLGGAVSIQVGAKIPDRVSGLVLAAPAFIGPGVFLPFRLMTLPVLGPVMSKASEKGVEMQLKGVFHPSFVVSDALRDVVHRNTMKEGGDKAFLNFMRQTLRLRGVRNDIWRENQTHLERMHCPVLILHGKDDKILPFQQSIEAAALCPNGKFELLSNCGHAPQLEKPHEFNKMISGFVADL